MGRNSAADGPIGRAGARVPSVVARMAGVRRATWPEQRDRGAGRGHREAPSGMIPSDVDRRVCPRAVRRVRVDLGLEAGRISASIHRYTNTDEEPGHDGRETVRSGGRMRGDAWLPL